MTIRFQTEIKQQHKENIKLKNENFQLKNEQSKGDSSIFKVVRS